MSEKEAIAVAAPAAASGFADAPPEYSAVSTTRPTARPMSMFAGASPVGSGLGPLAGPTAAQRTSPGPSHARTLSQRRSLLPAPPPMSLPILHHLRTHRVILASASPRRRSLLAQIGLAHLEIWPSTAPEDLPKAVYGPFEYVAATARRKCMHVYQEALVAQEEAVAAGATKANAVTAAAHGDVRDPELVIAADTVIASRAGQIVEKPRSAAEHAKMLRHLRDTRVHQVLTAVCVLSPRRDAAHPGYCIQAHTEETKVWFVSEADGLTDDVIDAYVRTREGADKAGGYALQGVGGLLLVDHIEGSVDNVVGLPVRRCLQLAEVAIFQQDKPDDEDEPSEEEE